MKMHNSDITQGMIRMLEKDASEYRSAGNKLALAAIRVINEYDGIHRLSAAVRDWFDVVSKEGGRNGRD
jgi:hypothetical protein